MSRTRSGVVLLVPNDDSYKTYYSPIDKECLALMFALDKLWHYLVKQKVLLISRVNPFKVLMTKACSINFGLVKWGMLLTQYDIDYISHKVVKGQVLADFLAAYPLPTDSPLIDPLLDETTLCITMEGHWKMFFDGTSQINRKREGTFGVRILLIDPNECLILHTYTLTESCSNNIAEYSFDLMVGTSIGPAHHSHVYGDSQLIINQLKGEYET